MNLEQAIWRRSSRSGAQNNCVAVAQQRATVVLRDGKDPSGPLVVAAGTFADSVRRGRFDA